MQIFFKIFKELIFDNFEESYRYWTLRSKGYVM
jgi:hypothetical protein